MIIYTTLSILLIASSIALAFIGYLWAAVGCGVVSVLLVLRSHRALRRSKANIATVLMAIKNDDHTFSLKGDSMGVNQTLNQIKALIQKTKKEVRDQERFLSIIIDQVPTGIIISTPDGTVRCVNHAALRHLSLPVLSHLHRIRQLYPELFSTLCEMKDSDRRSIVIQTAKDVEQLTLERTSVELASGLAHIFTINDINNQLDQRETDSWISLIRVMTHEIMNSIAPIRSISEVLLDADDTWDDAARSAVQTIHDTSDHLIRFVEDYRQFSAVPTPILSPIEPEPLLQQVGQMMSTDMRRKEISLTIDTSRCDDTLSADRHLLMQVLQNLLKNAIDATPLGGEIIITADTGSSGRAIINVYNSGSPIPDDVRRYIFIPFFSTKEGGSGIGLSLSRYIMRLHGGNLRYRPEAHGSTFVIEF